MSPYRLDLGTADELSLDVLVNMLIGVSTDLVGLRSIALGGVNEDWPLPVGMEEEEENRIPEVI